MGRKKIEPPLQNTFDHVYATLLKQPEYSTPVLSSTGGVEFIAKAKKAKDGRLFIDLPHSNRIYSYDWDYRTNSMGKDGQELLNMRSRLIIGLHEL